MSGDQQTWQPPRRPQFDGSSLDPAADGGRLARQLRAVFEAMEGGGWKTPAEIEAASGANWASASARLRDLRKPKFGGFLVDRRRKAAGERGLHEYRLRPPAPRQPDLFDREIPEEHASQGAAP
jgi:hypothetical protein